MYAGIYAALLTVVDVYIKKDAVLGLCDALFLPFGWSLVAEEKEDNANVLKFFHMVDLTSYCSGLVRYPTCYPAPIVLSGGNSRSTRPS